MKNTIMALLVLTVVILTVFLRSNMTELRKDQRQLDELKQKVESMSKTVSLDVQERCAKQAFEEFKRQGYAKHQYADFSNHYNSKLNKCFMQIQDVDSGTVKGTIITSKQLTDAFEGKIYGNYVCGTLKGKRYWEVPPVVCLVTKPSGNESPRQTAW